MSDLISCLVIALITLNESELWALSYIDVMPYWNVSKYMLESEYKYLYVWALIVCVYVF